MGNHAVVYKNGAQLFVPEYRPEFVQRLKRLVPPHARVFHQCPIASYTVVSPYHHSAIALAFEYFLDFDKVYANRPYEFPGDDRHLPLQQRRPGYGARAQAIAEQAAATVARRRQEGGR